MKQGIYPGSQAGDADMFDWNQDTADLDPVGVLAVEPARPDLGEHELGQLRAQHPDLRHVHQRPADHRGVDEGADGRPARRLRAGDHALQRQRRRPRTPAPTRVQRGRLRRTGTRWTSPAVRRCRSTCGSSTRRTGDLAFLKTDFPFMEATAQFLLAYQKVGSDGLLHAVANAHETQWAVQDPTTDIAADAGAVPGRRRRPPRWWATASRRPAARPVRRRPSTEIPPYPRTDEATRTQLLNPDYIAGRDAGGGRHRHRHDRDLLPAGRAAAERREHRAGAAVAVERRSATRTPSLFAAGAAQLHPPAEQGRQRLVHGRRSTPPGWSSPPRCESNLVSITETPPGVPQRVRRPRQHRRLPALHRAVGRRRRPRWTRRSRRTTTASSGSRRPGRPTGTAAARSTSSTTTRSTCRCEGGQLVTAAIQAGRPAR